MLDETDPRSNLDGDTLIHTDKSQVSVDSPRLTHRCHTDATLNSCSYTVLTGSVLVPAHERCHAPAEGGEGEEAATSRVDAADDEVRVLKQEVISVRRSVWLLS